jgi:hypothetical protein
MRRYGWALAIVLAAGSAAAAGGDPAAAEALFRQGREAMQTGDYALACEKFHESNRLDPAAGTVLNIADCEEKLAHLATAWTLFRQVAEQLPGTDERQGIAKSRAAALEPRLPRLSLRLPPDAPAGARVLRDGVALGSASLDTLLPVDPGKHVVAVEAPGHARRELSITMAEGEKKRIALEVGPVTEDSSGSGGGGVSTSSGSGGKKTVGYVLGGLGIAGVGVGAVTGILVLGKKSTVNDNCDAQKRCNATGADAADSGRTLGTISGVSFIVGSVALATGAYLVLSSNEKKQPTTALLPAAGGVSVLHRF